MPQAALSSAPAITTNLSAAPWTTKATANASRMERARAEKDLVERLVSDDPRAWRLFTQDYSGVAFACIRRVLTRFARVTNEQDLDEIYGRFCLDLLSNNRKKLRAFDPERGGRLSTWIGLLATNVAYDYLRSRKRDLLCDPLPEWDTLPSETQSPLEQAETQERASRMVHMLGHLSPRDREFLDLYFARGLSAEEVATTMRISVKTVYTKRFKLSAQLKALIAEQCAAK